MDTKRDGWRREIEVRFDAEELAGFFDAFAPIESPFDAVVSPPDLDEPAPQ